MSVNPQVDPDGSTCGDGKAAGGSHGYDLDEIAERAEIVRVAGVERQAGSARGRCKEEVDGTRPPRLASRGDHGGINPPISPCRLSVEGQRIECGFRALELATTAAAVTSRWRRRGVSSPTGTPLRVMTKDSPWSSRRMISPLSLRSSRWVMDSAIIQR